MFMSVNFFLEFDLIDESMRKKSYKKEVTLTAELLVCKPWAV